MIKITKIPSGPNTNVPVVGQMYCVHDVWVFSCWCKFTNEDWAQERSADIFTDLISSVPYVMLTKYSQNDREGQIKGQILVSEKLIDFWLAPEPDENTSCIDIWHRYFVPASPTAVKT